MRNAEEGGAGPCIRADWAAAVSALSLLAVR